MSLQNKGPEGRDAAREELADERGDLKGAPSPRIQQSDDQDLREETVRLRDNSVWCPERTRNSTFLQARVENHMILGTEYSFRKGLPQLWGN